MARSNRGKTTTDFGACRDLSGRRLRHVNDEIMLQKWQEAKSEGKDYDSESKRESGIANWFLQVPSWANLSRRSGDPQPRSADYKTKLCPHWEEARRWRSPPPNAPLWWGCPRAFDCEFAHGEADLTDMARLALEKKREADRRARQRAEEEAYVSGAVFSSDMDTLVKIGLDTSTRQKDREEEEKKEEKEEESEERATHPWMEVLSGSVSWGLHELSSSSSSSRPINFEGVVEGEGPFSSVKVSSPALLEDRQGPRHRGLWYYEAELVSGGLMQIGWASPFFEPSEEAGDGVGDDLHSFSFDGFRQLKWGGKAQAYGTEAWKPGDVVGCLLDRAQSRIRFSLNGEDLGEAFSGFSPSTPLFPCVSLEAGEVLALNLGQLPFRYPPPAAREPPKAYGCFLAEEGHPVFCEMDQIHSPLTEAEAESESNSSSNNSNNNNNSTAKEPLQPPSGFQDLALEDVPSLEALLELSAEHLAHCLAARGLKAGGSLEMRAERLWSVRGLAPEAYPKKLRAKRKREA